MLNLIAVGYSLGLAASVLWLGALGDRYGRKLMIVLGMALSVPASLARRRSRRRTTVLFAARVVGGLSAGMAYPTTLALITALWAGPARTKAIALWSALGGGIALLGPLIAGALLEYFDWGSVFLVTLPLVVVALPMAIMLRPEPCERDDGSRRQPRRDRLRRARRRAHPLDQLHAGARASRRSRSAARGRRRRGASRSSSAQRRAANPLYDLHIAARPTFWVAACAGIIVFGSLMGAAFISQQYLQNVLGYSTLEAGAAILPAGIFMVLVAPRSAKLVGAHGSRRHAPRRPRAPAPRRSSRCSCSGRRARRTGRSPSPTSSRDRRRPRGDAVLATR